MEVKAEPIEKPIRNNLKIAVDALKYYASRCFDAKKAQVALNEIGIDYRPQWMIQKEKESKFGGEGQKTRTK